MGLDFHMTRRIVLLSDGTGNSSASFWRTNVWRLFSALDLRSDEQIACYDDGVGTSSFKLLAFLGGAFGIGLRRNVISLYKFACRNYRSTGNEIFAFGFSRGAFTIRVLIGLIIDQGLIPVGGLTEAEFDRSARKAYRSYHKAHFHTNWGLLVRQVKKWLGKVSLPQTTPSGRNIPVIRFLGLWDTVAAYGLPIDEMTRGVSQWLWPLEIPTHSLHSSVNRACHALSLDDERTTFHPVLWDERKEPPRTNTFTSGERLSQVWFAGVHGNVGGGYPDDALAQVPLYWIMREAESCGIVFKKANPDAVGEVEQAQDKDGRLYDSRSGFGSYYRYGPRRLSRLCNELFSRTLEDSVFIRTPKIHESVFMRVRNNARIYAPIGIPHDYELVVTVPKASGAGVDFRIDSLPSTSSGSALAFETQADAQARVVDERAIIWPLVYLRAAFYLLTLLTTAFLVVFPFTGRSNVIQERQNELRWVSEFIEAVASFFPGWASPWVKAWAQYPALLLAGVAVLAILLFASSWTATFITDRMSRLWKESFAHSKPAPAAAPSSAPSIGERVILGLHSSWRDYFGPTLSAILIIYFILTLGNRWSFTALDQAGLVCKNTEKAYLKGIPYEGIVFSFNVSEPCFRTGYRVRRLDRYLIWTTPDEAEFDKKPYKNYIFDTHCAAFSAERFVSRGVETDGRGYETFRSNEVKPLTPWQIILSAVLLPLKRHYGEPWFQPVARYGSIGNELDFLEPDQDPQVKEISEIVTPKVSGELYFYFNDAVTGPPKGQFFYPSNKGCATFFVKPEDRNSAE
jgi:uncharacterized protein (DUF2235 family)